MLPMLFYIKYKACNRDFEAYDVGSCVKHLNAYWTKEDLYESS